MWRKQDTGAWDENSLHSGVVHVFQVCFKIGVGRPQLGKADWQRLTPKTSYLKCCSRSNLQQECLPVLLCTVTVLAKTEAFSGRCMKNPVQTSESGMEKRRA